MSFCVHVFVCGVMLLTIVNDIRNFVFGLAEATVYGFCKSREQKFVMSFTISICLYNYPCISAPFTAPALSP